MTEAELNRLRTLAHKWDGEADHYEARTDDDYSAHAMMLRYCAVQLRSAMIEPVPREHSWYFYMNGAFCTRCNAPIGTPGPCR